MDVATFFSGAGGEVDECSLLLRFFGDELEPEAITALLGAPPTLACRKGDAVPRPPLPAPSGRWLLECEQTTDTLDHQIMLLFGDLTDDLSVWESLAQNHKAELKCHLFMRRWNRGTVLLAETVEAIGARHLQLVFDIYTPHELWQSWPKS